MLRAINALRNKETHHYNCRQGGDQFGINHKTKTIQQPLTCQYLLKVWATVTEEDNELHMHTCGTGLKYYITKHSNIIT